MHISNSDLRPSSVGNEAGTYRDDIYGFDRQSASNMNTTWGFDYKWDDGSKFYLIYEYKDGS
jgi:hypothetical protein